MALLDKLKVGADVSWLPRWEGGMQNGGGQVLCQGVIQMRADGDNFKYLPFVPNGINACDAEMLPVISFDFSGCILATYQEGGVRKVCHVSTGAGQDCKPQWAQIKGQSANVFEFNPFRSVTGGSGNDPYRGCYGLVTPDLQGYAITVRGEKVAECVRLPTLR